MNNLKLLAVLLSAAIAAGCAGTSSTPAAAPAAPAAAAAPAVDDAAVAAAVKAALAADADLSTQKIGVESAQGEVTLKGEIKSFALRKKAQDITKGVKGVKSVVNN